MTKSKVHSVPSLWSFIYPEAHKRAARKLCVFGRLLSDYEKQYFRQITLVLVIIDKYNVKLGTGDNTKG